MGLELGPLFAIGSLVSTGFSVMGQIQQANAQQAMANYQAQIAENNRMIAEANARNIQQQAEQESAQTSQQTAQRRGKMLAMMGASGIDIGSSSFEDVMVSQEEADRLTALNTRYTGTARAIEMQNQANNFAAEAGLHRAKGQNAMNALPFQIGGTIASGFTQFAPRWREFERNR